MSLFKLGLRKKYGDYIHNLWKRHVKNNKNIGNNVIKIRRKKSDERIKRRGKKINQENERDIS